MEKTDDRYWQFSFIDEDPGIKKELVNNIFKLFTSYGDHEGSDLGLSIAVEIIESYKGRMWTDNRTDTPGAIFSFIIPQAEVSQHTEKQ